MKKIFTLLLGLALLFAVPTQGVVPDDNPFTIQFEQADSVFDATFSEGPQVDDLITIGGEFSYIYAELDHEGIDPTGTYHGDSDLQLERIGYDAEDNPIYIVTAVNSQAALRTSPKGPTFAKDVYKLYVPRSIPLDSVQTVNKIYRPV